METQQRIRAARVAVVASYALLLVVQALVGWPGALVLLPFGIGIYRRHWQTHIWLCFLLLFYFLVGVNAFATHASALAALRLALVVTLFVAALLYCRWVRRAPSGEPA